MKFWNLVQRVKSIFGGAESSSSQAPATEVSSEDEFDDTFRRMIRQIDHTYSDLRGDGARLETLIKRIEATTRNGEAAMRGQRS